MQIRNVTREILEQALAKVNERFNNNIEWKRIEQKSGRTRDGGTIWNVTLKAKSAAVRFSQAGVKGTRGGQRERAIDRANKGVRRAFRSIHNADGGPRHFAAACWHVHGVFFDSLPRFVHRISGVMIPCEGQSCGTQVNIKSGPYKVSPGDPWNDRNIGSVAYPMWYSEACDCGDEWDHHSVKVDNEIGYMNVIG